MMGLTKELPGPAGLGRRGVLTLATFLLLAPSGCKRLAGRSGEKELRSAPDRHGKRRVLTVPVSWSEDVEHNSAEEIAAGDRSQEIFATVVCEPKAEFPDYTLDRYSDITRAQLMKNLKGGKSGAKVNLQIGQLPAPAIQVELRGNLRDASMDGGARTTTLVYLHTSVELPESYCQVVGLTSEERWDNASAMLRKVAQSLREE